MVSWPALSSLASWLPSYVNSPQAEQVSSCETTAREQVVNAAHNTTREAQRSPSSASTAFSLAEVLSVAKVHPFYSDVKYPPHADAVRVVRNQAASFLAEAELKTQPFLRKKDLYAVIERLVNDTSPLNTYRHNVYTSVTGGGTTTSRPLFFATDALENRRHRSLFGQFLRSLGVVETGDWALTTHYTGDLYRSLDLTCEIMENAGASVLAVGNHSPPSKVVQLLQDFSVNVLMGDGSQVVSVIRHISTLTTGKENIKLDKIIYTSEGLTAAQKSHIRAVLGPVRIYSILGSAEAGPYGVSSPDFTPSDPTSSHADFIIDTRMALMEIFPLSVGEGGPAPDPLPEGETGVIAQTSLTRLRNPVVRYLTGDIGSLQPLPERARSKLSEADRPYMRVLRLQGRDRRFSFLWEGYDYELSKISTVMAEPNLGVFQWQVILHKTEPSGELVLELRVLSSRRGGSEHVVVDRLHEFFLVCALNERKFRVTFVDDVTSFERSQTGRKVVQFVDYYNDMAGITEGTTTTTR